MIETIFMGVGIALLVGLLGALLWWLIPIILQIIVTSVMLVVAFFRAAFERISGK